MVVLRADPWMPEFGMGFEVHVEEPPAEVDPEVETADWSQPIRPPEPTPTSVVFVDGVRRAELRLLADEGGRQSRGLFGSYAVGAVRCNAKASFLEANVCRHVVVGGGLVMDQVDVAVARTKLRYLPASTPGPDPDAPLLKLQDLMRDGEANMAARLTGHGDLVLMDGPLPFKGAATDAEVVGMIKRFARRYLGPEHESLLGRLGAGERTPLFALAGADEPRRRFAWYSRLVPLRLPWHDHAGLVRCEVAAGVGVDRAVALAGTVSALLPRFAGRPWDPRTPQNVVPVAGLETWLRHRMGHAGLVRRALLHHLSVA